MIRGLPRRVIASMGAALALALSQPTSFAAQQPIGPDYQDDRSTPEAVLGSLYNAINRHEYARAWSYWQTDPPNQSFDDFQQGFADTSSVQLSTGNTRSGVGAGQIYYATPVTLLSTMSDGSSQTFVGCYILHLARPALQANPPYEPMGIQRGTLEQVDNDADTASLMAQACPPV